MLNDTVLSVSPPPDCIQSHGGDQGYLLRGRGDDSVPAQATDEPYQSDSGRFQEPSQQSLQEVLFQVNGRRYRVRGRESVYVLCVLCCKIKG